MYFYVQVGSESSGKNAMVGVLAKLSGHILHVLSMNSGMDTTDFIGGFEQVCKTLHVSCSRNKSLNSPARKLSTLKMSRKIFLQPLSHMA